MKVEKVKVEPFQPITITIETRQEAQLMWASLNLALDDIRKQNSGVDLKAKEYQDIHYDMFVNFNQIYNARG